MAYRKSGEGTYGSVTINGIKYYTYCLEPGVRQQNDFQSGKLYFSLLKCL